MSARRSGHQAARRLVGAIAAVVLLAAACGDGETTSPGSTDPATATTAPAAIDLGQLEGRYAHFDVVAYEDEVMKTLIISYGFADLEVIDGELWWTPSFCFSEHRSDQPISVEFSDEATSAIVPVGAVVTVTDDDGVLRLSRPATPTGIGVRLDDPANDPLPTDPDDPRLSDDDGDGNPGVTARIIVTPELTGEIYLARREIFAYEVAQQADGSFVGHVDDDSEQLVIGASDPAFMTGAQWEQHPDRTLSPLLLRPVDRDWDCARLAVERDAIFPPTPEVDW